MRGSHKSEILQYRFRTTKRDFVYRPFRALRFGAFRKWKARGKRTLLKFKLRFTGLYIGGLPHYTDGHRSTRDPWAQLPA